MPPAPLEEVPLDTPAPQPTPEPAPIEPAPIEPAPIEPAPTDSAPTEPTPEGPVESPDTTAQPTESSPETPTEPDSTAPAEPGTPPADPSPSVTPEPSAASEEVSRHPAERPLEPMIGGKPRTGKGLLIAGGATLAFGIGTGIGFGLMTRGCDLEGPLQCKYQSQDTLLIPMSVFVIGLGVMLLSVGGAYYAHYRKWEQWTPPGQAASRRRRHFAVAPSWTARGGALVLHATF